jgi:RHS repeat-associated protein
LSNDELTPLEVYFDDFKVTQIKSPVVQQDDYYPFGLRFNSYLRENSLTNKTVLFQGQEHVDDLGLNWDSFKWRNHQPDIGRFFNIDLLSEKYFYNSTYAFSENHVTAHIELEGLKSLHFSLSPQHPITPLNQPKFGGEQFRDRSVNFTVDLSAMTCESGSKTPGKESKAPLLTLQKDGSIRLAGVADFQVDGMAAFSVTLKNNTSKDGTVNVQTVVVGDNSAPLEMTVAGADDKYRTTTAINDVPKNMDGLFPTGDTNEGTSNHDLQISGTGANTSLEGVRQDGQKDFKAPAQVNNEAEKKSTATQKQD